MTIPANTIRATVLKAIFFMQTSQRRQLIRSIKYTLTIYCGESSFIMYFNQNWWCLDCTIFTTSHADVMNIQSHTVVFLDNTSAGRQALRMHRMYRTLHYCTTVTNSGCHALNDDDVVADLPLQLTMRVD